MVNLKIPGKIQMLETKTNTLVIGIIQNNNLQGKDHNRIKKGIMVIMETDKTITIIKIILNPVTMVTMQTNHKEIIVPREIYIRYQQIRKMWLDKDYVICKLNSVKNYNLNQRIYVPILLILLNHCLGK